MAEIRSELWKAAQLAWSSTFFPTMVRAAAVQASVPFDTRLVETVAANPAILARLTLNEDDGTVDAALLRLMADENDAAALDNDIRYVVYQQKNQDEGEGE